MSSGTSPAIPPKRARRLSVAILGSLAALLLLSAQVIALPFANDRKEVLPLRTGRKQVRAATAAGQIYPAAATDLYELVERLLASSPGVGLNETRAILVPHAGYQYSGNVAAAAFREVDPTFRRVFVLASNHSREVDFSGVSLPAATHYAIPGAELPLSAIVDDLQDDSLFVQVPLAHTRHMIEAELPFLHQLRGKPAEADFTIIPMILGRMDAAQIARLAQTLNTYADDSTLFVFSLDLSHRHPDAKARSLDRFTVRALMGRDATALAQAKTDGNQVLLTMVALAKRRGWEPTVLMYQNSGDATGDRRSVVGYAAVAFSAPLQLTPAQGDALLSYARRAVEEQVRFGKAPAADETLLTQYPVLRLPRGVFVTIEKNGELRGCAGHLLDTRPLHEGVRSCVLGAAAHDSRFEPVTPEELDQGLSVSISILDFPQLIQVDSREAIERALVPQRDGLILMREGRQSTFLPAVWRKYPQPREFLSRLCLKQGRAADCWLDPESELYRFRTCEVSE